MKRRCLLACCCLSFSSLVVLADDPPAVQRPKLLLAFASLRDRIRHPQVYLYEHDGQSTGKLLPGIPAVDKRSDHHPQLTRDAQQCVYCFEVEGQPSQLAAWDLAGGKAIELPKIHAGDQAHMAPTIDATGNLIAFEAWRRPGSPGRWDLQLYDRSTQQLVDLSFLNAASHDERKPSLSGDGQWLAFTTNAPDGEGQTDLRIWRRGSSTTSTPRGLNSPVADTEPSLSHDGRLVAFISDRAGGSGARDVYLYDLQELQLVPLPGLNSAGQEQSPHLSADGRYLAFVSERLDSAGERDIYLYDIVAHQLLPTPELNSFRDEYDPFVLVMGQ